MVTGSFSSSVAPAVRGNSLYCLAGGILKARSIDGSTNRINQAVVIASASGNIYAVNALTGVLIWTGFAGASVSAPEEQELSQPLTGLGAGEGYLVVPAGNTLVGWNLTGT